MESPIRCDFERAFTDALRAADPAARVTVARGDGPRPRLAVALGKAAFAMARGIGPVERGIVVAPVAGDAPEGWHVMVGSHPIPDERSVVAGRAVLALVSGASPDEEVVVAISGGASALCEVPRGSLHELVAHTRAVMASGASIAELNRVRTSLSRIKGGQLARACPGRILTLVASDVVGDEVAVVGSGPTVAPERSADRTILVASIRGFAADLAERLGARLIEPPLTGDVRSVADQLSQGADPCDTHGACPACPACPVGAEPARASVSVAYGEPTLMVPADAGEGGRAQQLALELAFRFRGTRRAALVVGSDGMDGPTPASRPTPAGAFVDGETWEAMLAVGVDPARALERRDAGPALDAIGALVVTGPTGINHADVVLLYEPCP